MKQFIAYLFSLLLLVAIFLASTTYRQPIEDWWYLRSYTPSAEVAGLADTSLMSDEGRRIFYLSDPKIEDASAFQEDCQQRERSLVLGCFSRSRIFIFNVDDPRLEGVKEVTSAHEMLHAVYQRMTEDEKNELHTLLDVQLQQIDNQRVLDLLKLYEEQADGAPQYNEMHSIFGTELNDLSADLERHYALYFDNRAGLVAIAENYESVFTGLRDQADALLSNIELLKNQITEINGSLVSQKSFIDQEQARLTQLRQQLEADQASGAPVAQQRNQIQTFNALLAQVQLAIDSYNGSVGELNSTVAAHNDAVKEYNLVIGEQNELVEQLDSSVEEL